MPRNTVTSNRQRAASLRRTWAAKREKSALEQINAALFPPLVKKKNVTIDSDSYYELEGVLQDIKARWGDAPCMNTIRRVQERLVTVSKVLQKAGIK